MSAPVLPILAEGPGWVVVGKPSGLAVHRSPEVRDDTYLVQVARDQLGRWVWPVHRLDRATSGCLWLAFDPATVEGYAAGLAAGRKRYLALTRGACRSEAEMVVENPMTDSRGVLREARTVVRCLGASEDPRCSLFLAEPATGRYHQVRRHLRDLGHPVIGDGPHGDSRINRHWREQRGMGRIALHCLSLAVDLPGGGFDVVAPIPEDLRRVWSVLPWWEGAVARCPELLVEAA